MTPRAHLSLEEILESSSAPESDPRRQHLVDCQECQVLRDQYRDFLAAPTLSEAEHRGISMRVGRVLDELSPGRGPSIGRTRSPGRFERLLRGRGAGAWRPALAATGILVVLSGVMIYRALHPGGPAPIFRAAPPATGGSESIVLETTRRQPDGTLELSWKTVPGADAFRICLYSMDLQKATDIGPILETHWNLDPTAPALAAAPDTVLLRVTALRDSAEIGSSRLTVLGLR